MLDKDQIRRLLRNPALRPGERYGLEQQLKECQQREAAVLRQADDRDERPIELELDLPLLGPLSQPPKLPESPQPEPAEPEPESASQPVSTVIETTPAEPSLPEEIAEPVAKAETEAPVEVPVEISVPSPPPESAEELAAKIADVIDRIHWLRAYWATTLSDEVDRESEAWRARLQRLASKLKIIDPAAHDAALAGNIHLLAPLRDTSKPTIDERLQGSLLPPSAPSLRDAAWRTEIYFAMREPRTIQPPQHPEGYVADGLESFIS